MFENRSDWTRITCPNIQVFCTLARLLVDEADIVFTALIVQYLNWILLTSPNLAPLRDTLKSQRNNPKLGYVRSCVVEFRETVFPVGCTLLHGCHCPSQKYVLIQTVISLKR